MRTQQIGAQRGPTTENPATEGPAGGVAGHDRVPGAVRLAIGLLFLWGSGVHVGIVSGDPELYRHVADGAWFPGIRTAWAEVFMAAPALWGLAVAAGEFTIALLLLSKGPAARFGIAGAVAFHVGLMLLGWGFWLWSVPVLAALLTIGRRTARAQT